MRHPVLVLTLALAAASLDTATAPTGSQPDVARREAEHALARLRGNHAEMFWPLLRPSADNSTRSHIIHLLGGSGVDPSLLIDRLNRETDVSVQRALILSLGGFSGDEIGSARATNLIATLLRWYRDHEDAGVHGAIEWLIGQAKQGEKARRFDWGQAAALDRIDGELRGRPSERRAWYVNSEGHTLAIVPGPVSVVMGARPGELLRGVAPDSAGEPLHSVRVPRSFALASKEVTVAQFRRFLHANPEVKRTHAYANDPSRMAEVMARISPDEEGPQIAVTWYEAAMYCNWLSQRDGLPPSEWVYSTTPVLTNGLSLPPDYLRRTGYRLPTEAEWEYAARAGTTTARFYGSSEDLLHEYAWYSRNPPRSRRDAPDPADPQRTMPVGQLKPNDLGLFDVYGNVWEWTHDRLRDFRVNETHVDEEDTVRDVSDTRPRVRRGGAFSYEAAMMRSAHRGPTTAFPSNRRDNVGFRVARTYR